MYLDKDTTSQNGHRNFCCNIQSSLFMLSPVLRNQLIRQPYFLRPFNQNIMQINLDQRVTWLKQPIFLFPFNDLLR